MRCEGSLLIYINQPNSWASVFLYSVYCLFLAWIRSSQTWARYQFVGLLDFCLCIRIYGCVLRTEPDFISPVAAAKSLQSCPTLCDSMDCSLPGFSVHGILQTRTLEWVAISFSNAWKWKVKVKSLSRVWLLVTPWTAAHQAPPSMGFSGQQYWSGVPLPSPTYMYRYVYIHIDI